MTSISPEAIRSPGSAGGRSSATASPVTRSSAVRVANSGGRAVASDMSPSIRRPRVQWRAWTSTHTCWRIATSGSGWRSSPGAGGSPATRATSSSTSTSRSRPTSRSCARRPRTPSLVAYLSSILARARTAPVGTRDHLVARRRAASSPTGSRPRSTGCAGGGWGRWPPTSWSTGVMIWWLLEHPRSSRACSRPTRSTSWSTTTSRTTTASTPPRTSPPRCGSTTPGSPRCASPWGSSGVPVVYLLFQNVANLAIIGSIMIRHDHGGHFWGLILPARAARADGGLRGRRGRACGCSGRGSSRAT